LASRILSACFCLFPPKQPARSDVEIRPVLIAALRTERVMGNHTEGFGVAEMATSLAGRPTKAAAGAGLAVRHLNQAEVACRWSISPRKLERWRRRGQGPRFLKVGGRVVYRLADIEAF
jgi:hypothetical protein